MKTPKIQSIILLFSLLLITAYANSADITKEEWEKLERGKIVNRWEQTEDENGISRGSAVAIGIVDAHIDEVWKTLYKHDEYTDFFPSTLKKWEVKSSSKIPHGTSFKVYCEISALFVTLYQTVTVNHYNDKKRIEYKTDKSIAHNSWSIGYWQLESLDDNRTLIIRSESEGATFWTPKTINKILGAYMQPKVVENLKEKIESNKKK